MPEPIQTPVPAADELAAQVLLLAQSRLTADLRFLSSALEQLKPIPVPALDTLFAGDGRCLYYCPETRPPVDSYSPISTAIPLASSSFTLDKTVGMLRFRFLDNSTLDVAF